jgi:hypothetical protein
LDLFASTNFAVIITFRSRHHRALPPRPPPVVRVILLPLLP